MASEPPLIVLDDDPTGAQSESGVPVALEWDAALLERIGAASPRAVHLLTNTRSLPAGEAEAVTREAAAAALSAFPGSPVMLRGDSTLRAHLLPEYRGLRDVALPRARSGSDAGPGAAQPPAASHGTESTIIESGEGPQRLDATEYARDPDFGYASSRLLDWADERSGGFFPAAAGRELMLDELRDRGGDSGARLRWRASPRAGARRFSRSMPSIPSISRSRRPGSAMALEEGVEVIVRSAPAFVGVFSGATAEGYVEAPAGMGRCWCSAGRMSPQHPPARSSCCSAAPRAPSGSVPSRWRTGPARMRSRPPSPPPAPVSTTAASLSSPPGARFSRMATGFDSGAAIASGLAAILAGTRDRAGVVVSKGGITSAINVREGLASGVAEVLGPLLDGVSLWSVDTPERKALPFVVFPGNVGGDEELADLVEAIEGAGA